MQLFGSIFTGAGEADEPPPNVRKLYSGRGVPWPLSTSAPSSQIPARPVHSAVHAAFNLQRKLIFLRLLRLFRAEAAEQLSLLE